MITTNTPPNWSGRLLTNTGAAARLVEGPDCFGNITFEGDFGRGIERRYCTDTGIDVTSLWRFVRPVESPVVPRRPPGFPQTGRHRVGTSLAIVPATVSRSAPAPA